MKKMNWKKTVTSVVITTSLMTSSYAAMAADLTDIQSGTPASISYTLTDALNVEIKTVLNERVEGGTRIGVVVRMKNNGAAITRVPEYELRVKTNEGVEYTLQSSASNPRSIQPKAMTELSYLAVIDRTDTVNLAEANWTDVDYYVYPKKETPILAVPITGQSWKGTDMKITDPSAVKKWGETFKIPSLVSPLQYTPVSIDKEVTDKGTIQVLQLLVTNPSDQRETVPEFIIDGKNANQVFEGEKVVPAATAATTSAQQPANTAQTVTTNSQSTGTADVASNAAAGNGSGTEASSVTASTASSTASQTSQSFTGKKVEQGEIILEAKEQKYIHFAISTDNDTVLRSINILTPEKFSQAGAAAATVVSYNVGRLNILLPSTSVRTAYPSYTLGTPMTFDALSELIHPNLDVSVVEFHINDNVDEGSKSVTSKFKIYNKSDIPMAVPVFQTDLVSSDGFTYSGNRQKLTTQNILPNSGLVVSYSYTLPTSEKGKDLVLKVIDTQKAAPYKTTIAGYSIELQPAETEEKFSVYPFDAKVTYWSVTPIFNRTGNLSYSYKARFDLDLKRQEQIQIDASFSKLQFEIYDTLDRLIGTTTASFIGPIRLVNGENNIALNATSEQLERPLTIRLYEVFTTPAGDSKRLLGVYKQ